MIRRIMKYQNAGGAIAKLMLSNATNAVAEFVIVVGIEVNYAHATTKMGIIKVILTFLIPIPTAVITAIRQTMLPAMENYRLMHRITLKTN